MLGDGVRHGAEQEFFEAFAPVRSYHDTVRVPFGGDFENAHTRLAFDNAGGNILEAGGFERLAGIQHYFIRPVAAFLQLGIFFKKSRALDYMNQQDFTCLRTHLRSQKLSCSLGKLRTVKSQKYFHCSTPCLPEERVSPSDARRGIVGLKLFNMQQMTLFGAQALI